MLTDPNLLAGVDKGAEGQEIKQSGIVQLATYVKYMKAMGGVWVGATMIVLFAVTQASVLVTMTAVGRWAERPADEQVRPD
jgi:7-keto-8-aminopelargonate synthetase-like enzyme